MQQSIPIIHLGLEGGVVSSLHPTSFLMIFTLLHMCIMYKFGLHGMSLCSCDYSMCMCVHMHNMCI